MDAVAEWLRHRSSTGQRSAERNDSDDTVRLPRSTTFALQPQSSSTLRRLPDRCLSAGDRSQPHPAIAVASFAIMLNRPSAYRPTLGFEAFPDDAGYTFGYTWPKQEALSQWERASDLRRRW
jgi:hypothetical protein